MPDGQTVNPEPVHRPPSFPPAAGGNAAGGLASRLSRASGTSGSHLPCRRPASHSSPSSEDSHCHAILKPCCPRPPRRPPAPAALSTQRAGSLPPAHGRSRTRWNLFLPRSCSLSSISQAGSQSLLPLLPQALSLLPPGGPAPSITCSLPLPRRPISPAHLRSPF